MIKTISILFSTITRVALVSLLCLNSSAQQQSFFTHVTEVSGLSDNRITCFFKDKTGWMWIGTENGLNRFDGINFKIYKPVPDKTKTLSHSFITAISQNNDGDIIVATKKGINRIDAITGHSEIISFEDSSSKINLATESIWDVYPDAENLWIAIDAKPLLCYNTKTKKAVYYDFKKFLSSNKIEFTALYHSIFKILPDRKSGLWLATTEGIVHLDKNTGAFTLMAGIALDEISFFNYNAAAQKIYCTDERNILYIFDIAAKRLNSISLNKATLQNKKLRPWLKASTDFFIPAAGGIALTDEKGSIVAYLQGSEHSNGLLPGKIKTIYKDRDDISWIGNDRGISRFVPQLNTNLHVSFPQHLLFDREFSLKNIFFNAAGNEWLVASYADNKIWVVNNRTAAIAELPKPAMYKKDTCYSFYSAHPDTLFMLCEGSILIHLVKQKRWEKVSLPVPWNEATITCMAIDGTGNYWLGTRRKGLVVFNPGTKKTWSPYSDVSEANIIHALQYDATGNCIWIGTYSTGLHRYNFNDSSLQYIKSNDKSVSSFRPSLINDIAINEKNIWVGTVESALVKCKRFGKETPVMNYDFTKGLPDANVMSVGAGADGFVYFGTSKGLGVIDAEGNLKTVLNNNSGLPFAEFEQALVCTPGGNIATVYNNELLSFNPAILLQQKNTPIIIGEIIVNDSIIVSHNENSFQAEQNNISFTYAYLDFTAPGAIEYFYKLEGFDKDWTPNGNRHSMKFSNLPPGKYIFNIKAKKANGEFDDTIAKWAFTIHPPFWKTGWFTSIIILLTIALILFFIKQRIKAIRKQEQVKREYEKKITETEMQALRAQMNPHFMFNSINSINNFILKNDTENASDYLAKFSRLMRLILDNSRSEWIPLENEMKALELYIELEAVRFDNAFSYTIHIAPGINMQKALVPPMIIQPYVENAIWHGLMHKKEPGARLVINVTKDNNQLLIEIKDNGIGRKEAAALKSKSATRQKPQGMKITAERMDMVNKIYDSNAAAIITDIEDTEGNALGTSIVITLQYKLYDSHYSG
ncbi:MAG: histidine kinase [Chitinophagaceae bacterium]|nr:histidine kinase [Chitinophagaceae bacterium]